MAHRRRTHRLQVGRAESSRHSQSGESVICVKGTILPTEFTEFTERMQDNVADTQTAGGGFGGGLCVPLVGRLGWAGAALCDADGVGRLGRWGVHGQYGAGGGAGGELV
jgi:hypothetical protein